MAVGDQVTIDISASATETGPGTEELTVTVSVPEGQQVELTGTCWTLHHLIIELDRRLTRLARQTSLRSTS